MNPDTVSYARESALEHEASEGRIVLGALCLEFLRNLKIVI